MAIHLPKKIRRSKDLSIFRKQSNELDIYQSRELAMARSSTHGWIHPVWRIVHCVRADRAAVTPSMWPTQSMVARWCASTQALPVRETTSGSTAFRPSGPSSGSSRKTPDWPMAASCWETAITTIFIEDPLPMVRCGIPITPHPTSATGPPS